jgi:hypothetical protein
MAQQQQGFAQQGPQARLWQAASLLLHLLLL